jgi:ABC-type glycerol-3-phosphate transport system substrate-binding protein
LAYNEAAVTEPLPQAWEPLLEREDVNLILPAAGPEIGRLTLAYYVSLGGAVTDAEGQEQLAVEPLQEALELFGIGRQAGIISLRSSNVPDLGQAWQIFQGGEANVTLVTAASFLRNRAEGQFAAYGLVPGVEGPLPPLVEAWVWAISAADPARQQAAADLIAWLVSPDNLGAWSSESLTLPGRRAAFAGWPEDAYARFVREELERAGPFPSSASATYMETLEDAAFDVISLESVPADAAAQAAASVAP